MRIALVGGAAMVTAVLPTTGAVAVPNTSPPRGVTPVMVKSGSTTKGIDAALSAEAGVSGTLAQQVKGINSPVVGPVAAVGSGGKILAQTFSAKDGSFTLVGISLVGRSKVYICSPGAGYEGSTTVVDGGCAGGTTGWGGGTKPSGTPVSISAGTISSGVHVVSYTHHVPANYYGTIDATVKGSDGKVLDGWWMGIINARTGKVWGEDGSNQVPPGNYRVCIAGESNGFGSGPIAARTGGYVDTCYGGVTWWHGPGQYNVQGSVPKAATIVHVASGVTLKLTVTLPRAGGISGTVREQRAPHKVVRDAVVRVWHGNDVIRVGGANFDFIRLPAGRYTVCAGGGRAMPGKGKCWKAGGWTPSTTPKPNSANVSVSPARIHRNVNFALPGGFSYGAITGRVVGPTGGALAGVRVSAALIGNPSVLPRRARTDNQGRYTMSGLIGYSNARYRISFGAGPSGLLPDYPGQYPTPVKVSPGRTTSGIGVTMHKPGQIAGTVTDSHGAPVSGADVQVLASNGHAITHALTGQDGTYTLAGLAPTRTGYTICFYGGYAKSPTGYQPQCFDGLNWDG
jgi:hypothetical protein